MNEVYLTHYYFGNRFLTYKTGLGTIIRAKGHLLKVRLIFINNNFSWFAKEKLENNFDVVAIDINQQKILLKIIQEAIVESENMILFICNFDLIIENNLLDLNEFITILKNKSDTIELILTGQQFYSEIENIADYVSDVQLIEN